MQLRDRDILETSTDPTNKMLMRINIRVEPSDRSGGAYFADEILAFKKLQGSIDRRLRQPGQLFAQPGVNRFCCGMRKIPRKRSIHRQALRRDPDTTCATLLLEVRTPNVHVTLVPGRHLVAGDSHVRIIII